MPKRTSQPWRTNRACFTHRCHPRACPEDPSRSILETSILTLIGRWQNFENLAAPYNLSPLPNVPFAPFSEHFVQVWMRPKLNFALGGLARAKLLAWRKFNEPGGHQAVARLAKVMVGSVAAKDGEFPPAFLRPK